MFKIGKLSKEAIIEVAAGVVLAILTIKLLSLILSRGLGFHFLEGAEDFENLGGRGKARRAAKRETRMKNRVVKARDKQRLGREEGSAGAYTSVYDEEPTEEEELEQAEEMAEMAEYFNSLDADDLEQMDDAEYAEYAEFMEKYAA